MTLLCLLKICSRLILTNVRFISSSQLSEVTDSLMSLVKQKSVRILVLLLLLINLFYFLSPSLTLIFILLLIHLFYFLPPSLILSKIRPTTKASACNALTGDSKLVFAPPGWLGLSRNLCLDATILQQFAARKKKKFAKGKTEIQGRE